MENATVYNKKTTIDYSGIGIGINVLETLKEKLINDQITIPETLGSGTVFNSIQALTEEYKQIASSMTDLLSNTKQFLENVSEKFQMVDEKSM